ncbi:DUF2589 domain-containing protein [Ruminiclostridium papyrosolvens]|uniref:DUF2589 domain-containing protein n=1 Tax=Ruminiclostridium papyrosolvens C7 TaxID=1330534 RepID=U4QX44_9FIRM|nr:DUF2589 domain-containing protein [Ruminiclostridium papyrosolvens]EPR08148.1 hypothetical protein L323_18950 [Ruminiclostridium papyrosolvens C7]
MFDKNKEKNIHTTLSDIVRGMLHSVNCSQEILDQHYNRIIERYFNSDGTPITKSFNIDSEKCVDIPLITLINPSALALKEIDLEMSLHIDQVNVKKDVCSNLADILDRGSFNVSVVPTNKPNDKQSDMVDISMKFRAIDAPEGVSKFLDEFIKKINPRHCEPNKD